MGVDPASMQRKPKKFCFSISFLMGPPLPARWFIARFKTKIEFVLGSNTPGLLSPRMTANNETRKRLRWDITKDYDVRSRIVHGYSQDVPLEELGASIYNSEMILRSALQKILLDETLFVLCTGENLLRESYLNKISTGPA